MAPNKHQHSHPHDHEDDENQQGKPIDVKRIQGMAFEMARAGMRAGAYQVFTVDQLTEYCTDVATRIERFKIDGDIDTDADQG